MQRAVRFKHGISIHSSWIFVITGDMIWPYLSKKGKNEPGYDQMKRLIGVKSHVIIMHRQLEIGA
jgi:hypothetical protein